MRPVSDPLTFEQLVRQADVIVVVERAEPFKVRIQKENDGCMSERWPVTVRRVLRAPAGGTRKGAVLNVIVNPTALRRCGYIKKNLSVSYAAPVYSGANPAFAGSPPRRFVVFLRATARGPALTAHGAVESEARIPEIIKLIQPR